MANRNHRWWMLLTICLLLTGSSVLARQAHAQDEQDPQQDQQVLSITEIGSNGKLYEEVQNTTPTIVDINSTIRIEINKDVLRSKTEAISSNTLLSQQIEKAQNLQKAAENGFEALPLLQKELQKWIDTPPEDRNLQDLRNALAPLGQSAGTIIRLAEVGSPLRDAMTTALINAGRDEAAQYQGVLEAAAAEAARLRSQIDTILDREGVYYQMGAWIVSNGVERPIHLPGFDDYPEGEEFEVDRFNLQITADQLATLQNLETQALALKTEGIPALFDDFKKSLPSLLSDFLGPAGEALKNVESPIDALLQQVSAAKDSVRLTVEKTKTQTLAYRDLLVKLKEEYLEGDGPSFKSLSSFISKLNQDWRSLKIETRGLITTFDNLKNLPNEFQDNEALRQSVSDLVGGFTSIRNILHAKTPDDNIVSKISNAFGGLSSIDKINTEALEFGDEVKKFDISNLPDQTEFSLRNTGVRASGDAVVIKIAAGSKDFKRRDLESYQLQLFRVSSFIKTVSGLIYARPLEKDSDFEIGPAYNLLFSWGSRKSLALNSLWMPGIGISLSALDFNNDNTPEVGVAFVFSFLRDYIQFGGGLNVQEEISFGFFGVRLPLPTQTVGI